MFDESQADFRIPSGDDFISGITKALPELTSSANQHLIWLSKCKALSTGERAFWLNVLTKDSSAGDAIFKLSMDNDRTTAWLAKDYAVDGAGSYCGYKNVRFACLLFVELLGCVKQQVEVLRRREDLDYQRDFLKFAHTSLSTALTWFLQLDVSSEELEQLLLYRSTENELMLHLETRLTDKELSDALKISQAELRNARRLNDEIFRSSEA
jgi:hypothetical protein